MTPCRITGAEAKTMPKWDSYKGRAAAADPLLILPACSAHPALPEITGAQRNTTEMQRKRNEKQRSRNAGPGDNSAGNVLKIVKIDAGKNQKKPCIAPAPRSRPGSVKSPIPYRQSRAKVC